MKWIHHRMPLFLLNSDDVDLWLDPKISSYDAIDIINKRQNEEEVKILQNCVPKICVKLCILKFGTT